MTKTRHSCRPLISGAAGRNFSDHHPPLNSANAIVESDRCYFCYDAPVLRLVPQQSTFLILSEKSPQET
ncbi:MAG: hypothetical protein CM1200mP30_21110 [Pseudomonadota bacterium]|nr:MAG: hypothetical protein CM1200mP30_21110 [Pseudomonadota bacterium]